MTSDKEGWFLFFAVLLSLVFGGFVGFIIGVPSQSFSDTIAENERLANENQYLQSKIYAITSDSNRDITDDEFADYFIRSLIEDADSIELSLKSSVNGTSTYKLTLQSNWQSDK